MKTLIQLALLLFTTATSFAQLEWDSRKSIPRYGRHTSVSFEIAGKIYIGLGRIADGSYSDELWEYDPASDNWTQKADYPAGARFSPTGFSVNGKGYVCLGYTSSFAASGLCYEYDPSSDSWSQKASFPGTARYAAKSFVIGDTAYVGMGSCGGTTCYYNDLWAYIPGTNTWVQRANWPGGNKADVTAFAIGNNGYMGNGTTPTGKAASSSFYKYNPTTNSWTTIASIPGVAKRITSGFSVNGKGYVGCGRNAGTAFLTFYNTFHSYNPSSNTWTTENVGSNYTKKIDPEFITLNDTIVYSIGGYSIDESLSEVWMWSLYNDTCDYFDTTFVQDTTFIQDTTFLSDTITEVTLDTVLIYNIDTLYQIVYDTTFITLYDTVTQIVYDTTTITSYDTIYTTYTIAVEDTLIVNRYTDNCGNVLHKIYPNPTKDYLYLSSNGPDCFEGYKVQFIDALGKILETKPYGNVIIFDIRGYARSLYFLRLIGPAGDAIFSEKIILD
jgi:N-acetylneuraminic acid mutarotase